jgi:hypothetical protein
MVAPCYTYNHSATVVTYTGCHTGGSSTPASPLPGRIITDCLTALILLDHTRNEIWAMMPGANACPTN